jgi:hypothetical protein
MDSNRILNSGEPHILGQLLRSLFKPVFFDVALEYQPILDGHGPDEIEVAGTIGEQEC